MITRSVIRVIIRDIKDTVDDNHSPLRITRSGNNRSEQLPEKEI